MSTVDLKHEEYIPSTVKQIIICSNSQISLYTSCRSNILNYTRFHQSLTSQYS